MDRHRAAVFRWFMPRIAIGLWFWSAASVASNPPDFFYTPRILDFGPVGVGSDSPNQVVTITNTGSQPLINFAGGAPFDNQFRGFQNCAGGVDPGESCQYTFRFEPTAEGSFVTTSNSSTSAGPIIIELRGTGVGPEVSASPLSLDFGWVPVFLTGFQQTVTIRNTGLATLGQFAGGAPSDSQFQAFQNCANGVAPGESCEYTFTFRAATFGESTATSSSTTNAGPIVVALRGIGGRPPDGPAARVTPRILDFGPIGTGSTSPAQTVTITNQGNQTLGNFAGGAPLDSQFQGFQNCAGGVAPGENCQYTFFFTPNAAGSFATTSTTSTNAGPFVIELRGTGVGAGLSASPLALDFGPVAVGTTSPSQSVTIRNTGLALLDGFAGGAPLDDQFQGFQNCAAGVGPGLDCTYTFRFRPQRIGASQTTSTTSTVAGPLVVELRGFGIPEGLIFMDRFEQIMSHSDVHRALRQDTEVVESR